jgi:3-phosphoshikimate 1-carboxyvinyltransferase
VEEEDEDTLLVRGAGLHGFRPPPGPLDCGNAGTLIRLLPGVLAGQEGRFELTGDDSLRARPMERVAEPLRRMGARVETTEGRAPLTIEGGALKAIEYQLPVASAQVKSAVLLAGLYADGRTTVLEPQPTRDHTELMLAEAGARVTRRPASVSIDPAARLDLEHVAVPGDFSAAAPFVVAATLVPGSELTIHGVGLNPRRTGLLEVLQRMGGRVAIYNRRQAGREPVGDLEVHAGSLVATEVGPSEVPLLIDELPLFALAAAMARGVSVLRGAGELRAKESDRIAGVVTALKGLGVRISEREDGFDVRGVPARLRGGRMDALGDLRLAVLGAVAGLVSREGVEVRGAEAVAISFPGFYELVRAVAHV